ncbi:MAG: substrate-binding domain-containing protein [Planctomycetota bacterium]
MGLVRAVPKRGIILTSSRSDLAAATRKITATDTFHLFVGASYDPAPVRDGVLERYAAGIQSGLHSAGYTLSVSHLPTRGAVGFVADKLNEAPGGCFLACRSAELQEIIDLAERRGLPFVLLPTANTYRYALRARSRFPTVDFEREDCVREVVGKLWQAGHRRLAVAGSGGTIARTLGAFIDAVNAFEITLDGKCLFLSEVWLGADISLRRAFARHVVERIFSMDHRPTAIYCTDGTLSVDIVRECLDRGLKVGQDVSLVTTGLCAFVQEQCPIDLAGTYSSYFELGETAAKVMLQTASGTFNGDEMIYLKRMWTDGSSLGPPLVMRPQTRRSPRQTNLGEEVMSPDRTST